jgi:alkanesulfonate monooxygenase SsuD/methylene tetrahydromethanopterin reductase-like flavin-dependent oxidoreductase (luciferase family)
MRRVDQLRSMRYEDGLRSHALVGTPESVAERIETLRREIGLTGILAELNCGGLVPHRQVLTAMQLLCEDVKPRFCRLN